MLQDLSSPRPACPHLPCPHTSLPFNSRPSHLPLLAPSLSSPLPCPPRQLGAYRRTGSPSSTPRPRRSSKPSGCSASPRRTATRLSRRTSASGPRCRPAPPRGSSAACAQRSTPRPTTASLRLDGGRPGGRGAGSPHAREHASRRAARPDHLPVQPRAAPPHQGQVQGVPDLRPRLPHRRRVGGSDARAARPAPPPRPPPRPRTAPLHTALL